MVIYHIINGIRDFYELEEDPFSHIWLLLRTADSLLLNFQHLLPWKILETLSGEEIPDNVIAGDYANLIFWTYFFYNYPPFDLDFGLTTSVSESKSKRGANHQVKKRKIAIRDDCQSDWWAHSCLYGHKENVKKMIETFHQDIQINEPVIHGFRPIHLAIFSSQLATVQILLQANFQQDLNLSIRNDDGHNPLDIALLKKDNSIIKTLLKKTKPEMSCLVHAVRTRQVQYVSQFYDYLKESIVKHTFLSVSIQRFVELCKEVELRSTSTERKEACERNLAIFEKTICGQILSLYYPKSKTLSEIYKKDQEIVEDPVQVDSSSKNTEKATGPDENSAANWDQIVEEFSCPVCFFVMKQPERRIYSCSNDHWICSICLTDPNIKACPICRENFKMNMPKVRVTSERCLALLLENFKENLNTS